MSFILLAGLKSTTSSSSEDTSDPTVSITSPVDNSTLTGTSTVTVDASDNIGIYMVTLSVIGFPEGGLFRSTHGVSSPDYEAPYEFTWDSTEFIDGEYIIMATAHDVSGNSAQSIGVPFTLVNNIFNIITNPSFETPGSNGNPEGWLRGGWGTNTTVFTYPTAGIDGNAAKVEITAYTDGDAKWYFQDVPVTGGSSYILRNFYKSNVPTELIARYQTTTGTQYVFLETLPPAANWGGLLRQIIVPANATSITLFHILHSVGWLETDAFSLIPGTPPRWDLPMVDVTSPGEGAIVSGTINIDAIAGGRALDILGVQFIVDGIDFGAEDTTSPHSITLDTNTLTNGVHTLSARARGEVGNYTTTSAVVSVLVDNGLVISSMKPGIILNPSLETVGTNGDPENWFRGTWGTNNAVFTYPVAGVSDSKAARVEITSYTDGDAKWYFKDVDVEPGISYSFMHSYHANVSTDIVARLTHTDGMVTYAPIGTLAPATNWTSVAHSVIIPAGVKSVTMFHLLSSAGWLEVDDFALLDERKG
jgi:hypothetical protein